jgi:hypothetical protein
MELDEANVKRAEKFADWVCERTDLDKRGLKERFIGAVMSKLDLGRNPERACEALARSFAIPLNEDAVRTYRRIQGSH